MNSSLPILIIVYDHVDRLTAAYSVPFDPELLTLSAENALFRICKVATPVDASVIDATQYSYIIH